MAKPVFEKAIQQLEKIVEELESAEIPLEKAIQRFEEGTRLARACTRQLDDIEKRITVLMQTDQGEMVEADFNATEKSI